MIPALFLDLDSTVRYCAHPKQPCPNNIEDIRIYPKVVDKIKDFKNAGFGIFGVSNQGGIELGHLTEEKCKELMDATNEMMDFVFDKIVWASKMDSFMRKPNPGMIFNLQKEYDINLKASIMVGDKSSDHICAINAGIPQFFYARDFFAEGHLYVERQNIMTIDKDGIQTHGY